MFFSKQDYEYLLDNLTKKFNVYEFIDKNYLICLLDGLMNDGYYEDLCLQIENKSTINPLFDIGYRISSYLYFKICKRSIDDIDVLLTLVEDKRRVINLILNKMKVDKSDKIDDYVMEIASLYDGNESFDQFITRYIMCDIKGVSFTVSKPVIEEKKALEEEPKKKKKSKKKKNKHEKINIQIINSASVKEEVVEENSTDTVVFEDDSVMPIIEESLYDKCLKKCNSGVGTGSVDEFINYVLMTDIIDKVRCMDEVYNIYFLMRYGLLNGSYYTREEISDIMDISLEEVINLERKTIIMVKEYLNRAVNDYERYLLTK